jgi:tetratricopeptide (TPR) repeat protein
LGQAYVQLWLGRNIHYDLDRDNLALPALNESLEFMRAYDHYEEMIRALAALGASYLRQGHGAQARACLEEAYDLSHTQHFPWQRSEICYRLGLVALAEDAPEQAEGWAERARAAVNEGSGPDWLGPVYCLLARVARRRGAPGRQVDSLYRQAITLAETRCRGVERARVLREAGNYLAARAEGEDHLQARTLVEMAETWLIARGILEDDQEGSP